MDGRDTPPHSGIDFLRQLEQKTVSYTHLDVYKRQVTGLMPSPAKVGSATPTTIAASIKARFSVSFMMKVSQLLHERKRVRSRLTTCPQFALHVTAY